ncbi:endogenous retrovirus group K member 6 Gag polyprotein-like [Suncus etruscus]|uniref:endogenous retrovirus group K member 6 Gag polyprotein-like n=1 Tax=Suncus etruscus TaxID=109475 RepID=UPI00210FE1D3|nr:endogenous retrovirus group K member 6 Gag polyprotein-like [Suncus etruscus]
MGSSLSTEAKFIHDIQAELSSRKIHVHKADLCKFFTILHLASPWFVLTAPRIAPSTWATLGTELSAYCSDHLDSSYKNCILKYWQLLDGLITNASSSPSCSSALREAQTALDSASRSSTPLSPASQLSPLPPPPYPTPPPAPSALSPPAPSAPSLMALATPSDTLPPADQAALNAAAASYQPQPPPPLPNASSSEGPSLDPASFHSTLRDISSTLDRLLTLSFPRSSPSPLHAFPAILEQAPLDPPQPPLAPSLPAPPASTRPPPLPSPASAGAVPRRAPPHPYNTRAQTADAHSADQGRIYQQHIKYKALEKKDLQDVLKAVKDYGVQAPYTLACLDAMSYGGKLYPIEWRITARTALKPEQFVLWEAEFLNNCKELAHSDERYFQQLSGSKPFDTIDTQRGIPFPILTITSQAALKAWKTIPSSSAPLLPLSRIQQQSDEPYHSFISRLLEAIERTSGISDTANPLIKQLAYENANPACRALLKGRMHNKSLEDMISLCKDAHSFATQVAGALVAFQGQSKGRTCYACGQAGHFAGQCPERRAPPIQTSSFSDRPSLCPRCRRGRHWRSSCRATTDVEGNFLGPNLRLSRQEDSHQGNSSRGRPQTPHSKPRHINFVPASGVQATNTSTPHHVLYQHHHSQSQAPAAPQPPPCYGPPQVQQDLTSVPPPPTY